MKIDVYFIVLLCVYKVLSMIVLEKGQYSGNKIVEIKHDLFMTSVTSYSPTDFNTSRHSHPNTHLSFVLKGGCEEQKKAKYDRKRLSTTFYNSFEAHQINVLPCNALHLNIDLNPLFIKEINQESNLELIVRKDSSLPFEMVKLYKELIYNDDLNVGAIEEIVLGVFSQEKNNLLYSKTPFWVEQIKDYIQEYWNQSITLDELSIVTGLHKVSISKHFSRYTGDTITIYQRKLRLYKALELINSKQYSLTEIALSCGFSDQSHFIRLFKEYTSFLPKKFQNL